MSENGIGRRTFLKGTGLTALSAVGAGQPQEGRAQFPVPNSAGTEAPRVKAPANACDCHHHIYDARFPFAQPGARMIPDARVPDYRLLQRRIGTSRSVVVTPAPYPASVADNKVTLDAITEFGANSLEAKEEGQARLLSECWRGLQKARVCGGVVFEFADEWWKNYDNPRTARDWWDRVAAPDDELRHDNDPEEYYGLVTAERRPKPAFAVVQHMFSNDVPYSGRMVPAIVVAVLAQSSIIAWVIAWRAKRRRLPKS